MKKMFLLMFVIVAVVCAVACNNQPIDNSAILVSPENETTVSTEEVVEPESSIEESQEEVTSEAVVEPEPSIEESQEEVTSEEVVETESYIEESQDEVTYTPTELEAEALRLINEERTSKGLEPLVFATEIYECAKIRTQEIIECWDHTRPNGQGFRTVYEENGFDWKKYWTGENLVGRFKTVDKAIGALMNSEGHRKNLLCPEYDSVAICILPVEDGKYYMTQLFLG